MKVLLDNSIFSPESIKLLKNSKLADLSRRRIVKIYGNPVLLDEIYNLWPIGRKMEMKEYLEYILGVTNERWFRGIDDIIALELRGKQLANRYFFYTSAQKNFYVNQITRLLISEQLSRDEENELEGINQGIEFKKTNIHEVCSSLRNLKRTNENFDNFFAESSDNYGEELFSRQLKIDKSDILINNWKQSKDNFPFSTLWIKGIMYITYYARRESNKRLDRNANSDINQIIYLRGLDAIVSEEKYFLKSACNQLYGSAKQFLNLKEFLVHLN